MPFFSPTFWRPRPSSAKAACRGAGIVITSLLALSAASGCILFDGLYQGPYPCDDNSHCPGETVCSEGTCSEAAGEPCETDQSCPDGQFCNTTENVCGDGNVFDDDFVVNNAVDLEDLLQYHRVRGAILVGPDGPFDSTALDRGVTEISLPRLVSAEKIVIENQQSLATLDLPALSRIGNDGLDIVNNGVLEAISLPALTDVDRIEITGNATLRTIRLDSVVRIAGFGGGQLTVDENPELTLLNLPQLEFANLLAVTDSGSGATPFVMNAPNLAELGILFLFASSYSMESLDLPRLTSVGGTFSFLDTTAMTQYSMPALTTVEGDFNMSNHEVLAAFTFPSLTTVGGDVDLGFNDLLDNCELVAFFDNIAVGGEIEIEDNAECQ